MLQLIKGIPILTSHMYITLQTTISYVPLGILYPFTTTSSDDNFPINGTRVYNLSVSLIHIAM